MKYYHLNCAQCQSITSRGSCSCTYLAQSGPWSVRRLLQGRSMYFVMFRVSCHSLHLLPPSAIIIERPDTWFTRSLTLSESRFYLFSWNISILVRFGKAHCGLALYITNIHCFGPCGGDHNAFFLILIGLIIMCWKERPYTGWRCTWGEFTRLKRFNIWIYVFNRC